MEVVKRIFALTFLTLLQSTTSLEHCLWCFVVYTRLEEYIWGTPTLVQSNSYLRAFKLGACRYRRVTTVRCIFFAYTRSSGLQATSANDSPELVFIYTKNKDWKELTKKTKRIFVLYCLSKNKKSDIMSIKAWEWIKNYLIELWKKCCPLLNANRFQKSFGKLFSHFFLYSNLYSIYFLQCLIIGFKFYSVHFFVKRVKLVPNRFPNLFNFYFYLNNADFVG